jgi:hypothetical protein
MGKNTELAQPASNIWTAVRLASAVQTLKSFATRKSALVITWDELFKLAQPSTKEMDATLVNASKMDRFPAKTIRFPVNVSIKE